jgi:hypothetical protein
MVLSGSDHGRVYSCEHGAGPQEHCSGCDDVNMECRKCGYQGDDVHDFISTETTGERMCPRCNSDKCFLL